MVASKKKTVLTSAKEVVLYQVSVFLFVCLLATSHGNQIGLYLRSSCDNVRTFLLNLLTGETTGRLCGGNERN